MAFKSAAMEAMKPSGVMESISAYRMSYSAMSGFAEWVSLLAFVFLGAAWYSKTFLTKFPTGEPPVIPYRIPWLGYIVAIASNAPKFIKWVRSVHPDSPAVTVKVAGRHLYLIFDPKMASNIFRRSRNFIFDPFIVTAWTAFGATKKDVEILEIGAQVLSRKRGYKDDGRRVLLELHHTLVPHLTGEPLESATAIFVEEMCKFIDERFPPDRDSSYEWEVFDLCEYVKSVWTHASTIALFGTHVYTIWPDVEEWIWRFDKHVKTLITGIPRIFASKAYAEREEALELCQLWESDAEQAYADGKYAEDTQWDPYWGQSSWRARATLFKRNGLSARARAASHIAFLWGQTANAVPIAGQVLSQAVLQPGLLSEIYGEILSCQTGPSSFDMRKVTTKPKLKSILLETLRWATSSPAPRMVREDCEIGPYKLLAGNIVIIDSRSLQMDSGTWQIPNLPISAPENFWPERFLDGDDESEANRIEEAREAETAYEAEATSSALPKPSIQRMKNVEPISGPKSKDIQQRMLALRPFGGGTTLCPGRHFATNEILGGLAALMLRLEIEVIEEELLKNGRPLPDLSKQGGLFPDRPVMVRIRRRRG